MDLIKCNEVKLKTDLLILWQLQKTIYVSNLVHSESYPFLEYRQSRQSRQSCQSRQSHQSRQNRQRRQSS